MIAAVIAAGLFGTIIGSFLSVVAYRVPRRESIVFPGSACPACGHELRWRENVPIVSWLALRGRCAACGEPVSARYPALEVTTGLLFALTVAVRGLHPALALQLPFVAMLIVVAVIDFEHRVIPNPIVATMAAYGVLAGAIVDLGGLPEQLIAGVAAFTAFLLITLAYPAGMGMGDVKLAGVLGLYLGLAVVPAALAAFLSGSIVGIAIVARSGRRARKQAVPFAPFLALGGLVGVLAGHPLIDLYADRFL